MSEDYFVVDSFFLFRTMYTMPITLEIVRTPQIRLNVCDSKKELWAKTLLGLSVEFMVDGGVGERRVLTSIKPIAKKG